jgi:benzoate-CoA ligase
VAFYHRDRRVTYAEVAERTNRTGHALRELGVEEEQRVLLLLHDSPEFACAFFGAIKIGAVAVPVSTLQRPEECAHCLNDSRARVLVVHDSLLDIIEPIRDRLPYLRHVVVVPTTGTTAGRLTPRRDLDFDSLLSRASPTLAPAPTTVDDAAFWLYTSGSTGPPKGAVHLHAAMPYCADTTARHILGFGPDDIAYSVSKLFFAYGLGNGLYFPLRHGASAVHDSGRPTPESIFEVVGRYRPTLVFTVPTMYARLLQVPDADRAAVSSVRLWVSSGEPLPVTIFHQWEMRFGAQILDVVGSTENLHDFLANRPGQVRPGSAGQPVPGYECRIVDETGLDLPAGQIGHLLVRGGSTAACYWNRREATRRTMLGEWLRTGDMFYRDADGYYWYCGRADDMLKVGGQWVSPHEVENALLQHPTVLEAAVTAAPDEHGLLKPRACVVLKDGHTATPALADELHGFVRERLAPHKTPRWVEFVGDLPRTATGKVQRYRLRTAPAAVPERGHTVR